MYLCWLGPFFRILTRLRHTWATTLRAGGMDLADVQALIGHTSARTTERYAMAAPGKLMGAVDVLGRAQASAREHVENEKNERTTRGADRVTGWLGKREGCGLAPDRVAQPRGSGRNPLPERAVGA